MVRASQVYAGDDAGDNVMLLLLLLLMMMMMMMNVRHCRRHSEHIQHVRSEWTTADRRPQHDAFQ